ncbi:MAG: hypothetical protein U0Q21_03125 [Dermatophilaceae bacterium]
MTSWPARRRAERPSANLATQVATGSAAEVLLGAGLDGADPEPLDGPPDDATVMDIAPPGVDEDDAAEPSEVQALPRATVAAVAAATAYRRRLNTPQR